MHHESKQPEHEQYRNNGPEQTAHEVLLFCSGHSPNDSGDFAPSGAQRDLRANSRIKIVPRRSSTRNDFSRPTTRASDENLTRESPGPEPLSATPTSER